MLPERISNLIIDAQSCSEMRMNKGVRCVDFSLVYLHFFVCVIFIIGRSENSEYDDETNFLFFLYLFIHFFREKMKIAKKLKLFNTY